VRRVVIDTNVVVSSLFGGRPGDVMRLWRDGAFLLCLTDEIVAEYLEVLARFEAFTATEARDLLELLAEPERTLFVEVKEPIQEIAADPADNMFLECAVAADAQVIVSGDKHLLDLGAFRGVAIASPVEFVEAVSGG